MGSQIQKFENGFKPVRISKPLSIALVKAAARGKTMHEIEAEYNVPAAQAYAHITEELGRVDIWTDLERERLLLVQWDELKNILFDRVRKFADNDAIDTSKTEHNLIAVLREVGGIVERRKKLTDDQMNKVAQLQASIMLPLISKALEETVSEMSSRYPEIESTEFLEIFENSLRDATIDTSSAA